VRAKLSAHLAHLAQLGTSDGGWLESLDLNGRPEKGWFVEVSQSLTP